MKLYASPTSPYARLVRAVILEKGIDNRVEIDWLNPWDSPARLVATNPFSRVPTLETDDAEILGESLLIALYLEGRYPEPELMPRDRIESTYHKLGLGKGLIDAAVDIVSSRRFRKDADQDPIVKRRFETLRASVPTVAAAVSAPQRPDLGDIAIAVALGYLDFRLPEVDWRSEMQALADWYAAIDEWPSLQKTRPQA